MTLLSRALWQSSFEDDSAALVDVVLERIGDWVWESDPAHTGDGIYVRSIRRQVGGVTVDGTRTIAIRRNNVPAGLRVQVDDQLGDTIWGVSITVAAREGVAEFVVDNSVETADPSLRVSAGRPRVVDALLGVGARPRIGSSAIQTTPVEFDEHTVLALNTHLLDQDRALPVIAVTCSRAGFSPETKRAAGQLARRLTGLGVVTLLDSGAQDVLKRVMPDGLGVWGGAVRVYGLGPLVSADAWRHRFFTAEKFPRATDQLVSWVISITARRRIPDLLRAVERATTTTSDVAELQEKIKDLETRLEETELDLAVEQEERASLDQQLNQAIGHNARMRAAGFELGRGDEVFSLEHPSREEAPDDAQSVGDAFLQGQVYLADALAMPDSAARDHDRLDSSPNAAAWGNSTWRGLLSLAAYSRAKTAGTHSGNFWAWCERGSSMWPASSKKLAMSESETTANSRRYRAARVFAVDRELDATGERYMEAHLKISEGGGNLAPRVYFFDDTEGPTRKVHVGFVGPHDLVPNSKA